MKNSIITDKIAEDEMLDIKPLFFHIGWMRTGTTFLQGLFKYDTSVNLSLKNRFFSYDPYYKRGISYYRKDIISHSQQDMHRINIDSDENYSMGRFKTHVREACKVQYNHKSELSFIYHDIPAMVERMKACAPEAKIFGIIRMQPQWFESVYKHDVFHFGLDQKFADFYESDLGNAYRQAADYQYIYQLFADAFQKENVKILLFEDFVTNPSLFNAQLAKFLDVDVVWNTNLKLNKNASTNNFFTKVHRYVNTFSEKNPCRPETNVYSKMRNMVSKLDRLSQRFNVQLDTDIIPATLQEDIRAHYAAGNRQLAETLGLGSRMKQYGYF